MPTLVPTAAVDDTAPKCAITAARRSLGLFSNEPITRRWPGLLELFRMGNVARNLHHAARRLRRAPVFTITSVLTLTIGIGACALMMSVVSTILLKRLPYGQPDRLEMIWGYYPDANLGFREQPTHGIVFSIIRDNTQAFQTIAAFRGASYNLGDATNPERLDGVQATGEFFQTLGVAPEIGRFFERANETPGSDHVAILSDAAWRRRFGADPHIIGRVLTLNAEPYTVIGVAARGFAFPRGSEMPGDFQFAADAGRLGAAETADGWHHRSRHCRSSSRRTLHTSRHVRTWIA